MLEHIAITIGIVIVAVMIMGGIISWRLDIRIWNNGICKENGLPWEIRDRDSHGGYLIKAGDVRTWVDFGPKKHDRRN